jgi:hypothetical protein
MPELQVEETASGIAVVVDVEARRAARKARRQEKRSKARKTALSASQGRSAWMSRSKRISKVVRIEMHEHGTSKTDATQLAKMGQALIDHFTPRQKHAQ